MKHFLKISTKWCSFRPQSSIAQEDSWLNAILPSAQFLQTHVRNPPMKERLSNRITELQFFKENFPDRHVPKLDDSSWLLFLTMHLPSERGRFLLELSNLDNFRLKELPNDGRKISEINKEKYEAGEMVYAPDFYQPIDLTGREFRRKIDSVFGSRLMAQERIEESLPKLIIDCQFMKNYSVQTQMYFASLIKHVENYNWKSRKPFRIDIANFAPDIQLANIAKKYWVFRYGPPSEPEFKPHMFAPTLSARNIKDVSGCDPDSIMYISWRATRFLPDTPPSNVKAIVLCASNDDNPSTSSLSAAMKDRIGAYRIPVKKYQHIAQGQRTQLTLPSSVEVLAEYFSGGDIGEAIRRVFQEKSSRKNNSKEIENNFIEQYTHACESIERSQENQRKQREWLEKPIKKPRVHRYSREERGIHRQIAIQ